MLNLDACRPKTNKEKEIKNKNWICSKEAVWSLQWEMHTMDGEVTSKETQCIQDRMKKQEWQSRKARRKASCVETGGLKNNKTNTTAGYENP